MPNKVQVPTIGGLRKKITLAQTSTATTIAGLEGQTLTIAQLALLVGAVPATSSGTSTPAAGGSGSSGGATLVPGPGLAGGGTLLGNVPIRLIAPIPYLRRSQDGQRGRRGPPGQNGTGGGGGGGSLSVTDGTTNITGVTSLRLNGAVVSGSTPNAIATISGGGTTTQQIYITRRRQAEEVRGRRGPPGANGTGGGGGSGVTQLVAGSNITLTPSGGTGVVTVAASGGGSSLPSALNIPNLQFWFDASQINANAGSLVPVLSNGYPPFSAMAPELSSVSVMTGTIASTQLNGKNVVAFVTSSGAGGYLFGGCAPVLHNSTVFCVFSTTNALSDQSLVAGSSNAYSLQVDNGGSGGSLQLSQAFVSVSGQSSPVLLSNTWYQVNATYDDSTGAYAFRIAQTAEGSGTYSATMSAPSTGIGYTVGYGQNFSGLMAEMIIFDRVLTSGEITGIETYLNTKWGV